MNFEFRIERTSLSMK